MPMPRSWVDALIAKLSLRYGAAFLRQYGDADPELVKADWADVLDGVSGASVSYALRYLPNTPPNALQFRDVCRRAPAPVVAAIAAPVERAAPERVAAIVASATRPAGPPPESPADQCARNILRIVDECGGRISQPQRQQLAVMARLLAPDLLARAARYAPEMAAVAADGAHA